MKKIVMAAAIWFALSPPLQPQSAKQAQREACMEACLLERPDADIQRQEVIALEKETAHAIQLKDATFFRRVYSDGFSGVLSRGETVDKAAFIAAAQSPDVSYESFTVSDLKVKLYRDIAVVSGTWSVRAVLKGQRASSQMRILHVYLYGGDGYHLISAQATLLPPYVEQPL
jgi:ketosteroid isomerase-like protein